MEDTLSLRDIHGLEQISWWPLAPGWWVMLAVLLLMISGLLLWHYRYKHQLRASASLSTGQWQTAALQEWRQLYDDTLLPPKVRISHLAALLRRVAIRRYGREQCAGLQGKQWLMWLQKHDPEKFDWCTEGQLLLEFPYKPAEQLPSAPALEKIFNAVKAWIE